MTLPPRVSEQFWGEDIRFGNQTLGLQGLRLWGNEGAWRGPAGIYVGEIESVELRP